MFTSCTYANKKHIKKGKHVNQQQFVCISKTSKHFSIHKVWRYKSNIFYKLSMPFNNCNSNTVKWSGSGKCHKEVAMEKDGWCLLYSNTFKCLCLSLMDCHSNHNFDQKLFSAQFKGNSVIWWAYLNPGGNDSFSTDTKFKNSLSTDTKFHYYAVLLQTFVFH